MSKTVKYVFVVMSVTILAKIIGFGRDIVMAGVLGATEYTDAYLVALSILEMLAVILMSAFGTIFIPIFSKLKKTIGNGGAIDFTNNVINIMLLIGVIVSVVGVIFTRQIILALAPGFDQHTFSLAVGFTRVLIFGAIFLSGNCILTAYLQSNESFAVPAAISIPYNIIIAVSMFLSVIWEIEILIYGTLIAMATQFVMQFVAARKKSFKYRPLINFKDENIIEMGHLAPPLMMSSTILQVQAVVDKILISHLAVGSITAISLAQRLYSFAVEIFAKSVLTVVYPIFSSTYSDNNMESLKIYIEKALIIVTLLTMPVAALTFVLDIPIIQILFERGSFGANATLMTSIALSYYALGIPFGSLLETLTSIFYSIKDTKTPLITSVFGMVVNISLKLLLVGPMGLGGIALATSLSYIFIAVFLAYRLKNKIGSYGGIRIINAFLKILVSSIVSAAIAKFTFESALQLLPLDSQLGTAISFITSFGAGVATYLLLVLLFKIGEVQVFIGILKEKIKSQLAPG